MNAATQVTAMPPSPEAVYDVLKRVGEALDEPRCFWWRGSYHFPTGRDGWSVAITPDSAGRVRISRCHWSRPVATVWCLVGDRGRLARETQDQAVSGVREGV